jgi:hypothetical protein
MGFMHLVTDCRGRESRVRLVGSGLNGQEKCTFQLLEKGTIIFLKLGKGRTFRRSVVTPAFTEKARNWSIHPLMGATAKDPEL